MKKFNFTCKEKLRKIPILVTEEGKNEWRVEIADNYEDYKPTACVEINFEDVEFHFSLNHKPVAYHRYLYKKKQDAIDIAIYINKKYLANKGKIWKA